MSERYQVGRDKIHDAEADAFLSIEDAVVMLNRQADALFGMINQFSYTTKNGEYWTGGISALEEAFDALGWMDHHPMPESLLCCEPGCKARYSGTERTSSGIRKTCHEHSMRFRKPRATGRNVDD